MAADIAPVAFGAAVEIVGAAGQVVAHSARALVASHLAAVVVAFAVAQFVVAVVVVGTVVVVAQPSGIQEAAAVAAGNSPGSVVVALAVAIVAAEPVAVPLVVDTPDFVVGSLPAAVGERSVVVVAVVASYTNDHY